MINVSEIIAPAFHEVFADVQLGKHTHYIDKGGRGSMKSSFIGITLPLGIMQNPGTHALVLRQTANTLYDSVYAQLLWGIEMLGVADYWIARKSPLKLIYKPTGQQIMFRGADDPLKLKSIKPPFGYFRYVWFEELHEFMGMDAVRSILQSSMRGGDKYTIFYSFNPPKSANNWVNAEILERANDSSTLIHHSTYLEAPVEWLGEEFILEAEKLKARKPEAYRHEYLGEVTGTGGMIFDNVELREIPQRERDGVDYRFYGLDWGFAVDPAVFLEVGYDRKNDILYVLNEIYGVGMSNKLLASKIIEAGFGRAYTLADSAEPKSIVDVNDYGLNVQGVAKWPGSVKNGIEFLQDLDRIIIDPVTCPNAAREFSAYEYDVDRYGNFISQYPDKDNHTIDAARYAMSGRILEYKKRLRKSLPTS